MRKLKYINRITSIIVTILLFAASMFLFEACSSDDKEIGYHENNRVVKIKSSAENEVNGVYSVVSIGVGTITSAVKMTANIVNGILHININAFSSAADFFRVTSSKQSNIELY